MKSRKSSLGTKVALGIAAMAMIITLGTANASAQISPAPRAVVTITNITSDQIFSPPLVVSHDHGVSLFSLGEPASEELSMLAEDGMTDPLVDLLDGATGVLDVAVADGMVLPGESITVEVSVSHQYRLISLAGMLVSTNDAFFALDGLSLELRGYRKTAMAMAYDAGSEANTESCEHIPGPPCENPGVRVPEGAEGFVLVHSGIHGIADLEASNKDWNNPVAMITIQRAN